MSLIVDADVLTRGLLVGNSAEDDGNGAGLSQAEPRDPSVNLTDEERQYVAYGEVSCHIRRGDSFTDTRARAAANRMYLDNTCSQLTYTDLFALVYHTPSGCVCCAKRPDIELEYLRALAKATARG